MPTNCPACGSSVSLVNSQLFCTNKVDCSAQNSKKVENFAKVMKIKGLGPQTISKLELESVIDIYGLSEEEVVGVLGEKTGKKLIAEIELSKRCDFATFLSSLSIPLIGKTAAEKVAEEWKSLIELKENLVAKSKSEINLYKWLEENAALYSTLPIEFTKTGNTKKLTGDKVCITGKLKDFSSREKAKEYLESLGFVVVSTITKDTKYLVNEENKESSKTKKAKELNIQILTISELEGIKNE